MATPYRSTCTIAGTSFDCVSISVELATAKDQNSLPLMSSMQVSVDCLIDFHDDGNVPYSTLQQVFSLAQKPKTGSYVEMKVEYWKDETKSTALCSYNFQGWVSSFKTYNPPGQTASPNGFNHMWLLTLEPSMNSQNYTQLSMGN